MSDDLSKWTPWLRTVARGIDPNMVDDLAQEGMIAVWMAEREYDSRRSPLNYWLKFKAYRRMVDVWKSHRIRGKLRQVPSSSGLDSPVWMDTDTIELTYHHTQIMDAINALTPRQREYVYMRFWQRATGKEMRAHFGYDPGGLWRSPANGARWKLQRSLAHLSSAE